MGDELQLLLDAVVSGVMVGGFYAAAAIGITYGSNPDTGPRCQTSVFRMKSLLQPFRKSITAYSGYPRP